MMNSRAGATSSSSKGAVAKTKSGLASNGKPFRIRLIKCGIDHKEIPVLRKNIASRPSPARGSSQDLAKPSATNTTALNINVSKRDGLHVPTIPKTRNGSVQPPAD